MPWQGADLRYCGNPNVTEMVACVEERLGCNAADLRGSISNVSTCIRDRSYYLVNLATVNDDIWINLYLTTQWTIFTWLALESGTVAVLAAIHGISAARRYGRPRLFSSANARKVFDPARGVGLAHGYVG